MTITNRFVDAIWGLSEQKLPENIIEQAKMCLVDYTACAFLGASVFEKESESYLESFSMEHGKSTVVGLHRKTTMQNAAMINGMNSHAVELDDGHRYAMLHLGAPVISAALAVAETSGMDAEHFLKGIVVGYEATTRLASAIQPGHKLKGFHATGTCGTIGTAMGLSVALGYSKVQLTAALAAAATSAAGLLQMIDEGSQMKPYNVGRAAAAAINAVFIGRTGFEGPSDVLGGKRGFFAVAADEINERYLFDGFYPEYAIQRIYRKPYASCRHCHAAIEAALNILRENHFQPEEVERICIDTYGLAVKGHDHTDIRGASSAKMSMPYSVAAAIVYGQVNYSQYEEECLQNKMARRLMSVTEVREDPALSCLVPSKRSAIVHIVTKDKVYSERVDYPKGEPENPLSRKELDEKYASLMKASGEDEKDSTKILNDIYHIETEFGRFLQEIGGGKA